MTDLRRRMLEELQRRNFSETTSRRTCESLKISLSISASVPRNSRSQNQRFSQGYSEHLPITTRYGISHRRKSGPSSSSMQWCPMA